MPYAANEISHTPFPSLDQLSSVIPLKLMPWSTDLSGVTTTGRLDISSQLYITNSKFALSNFQRPSYISRQRPSGMSAPTLPHNPTVPL